MDPRVGYREPAPRLDSTLWYGPFPARWWPVVVSLLAALVLGLITLDGERTTLRSIECTRRGRCTVTRGSDWIGPRAETFDAEHFDRVEVRRTTGKNPTQGLWLVSTAGDDYVLLRGPDSVPVAAQIKPFFEARSADSLSFEASSSDSDRVVPVGLVLLALLSAMYFARSSVQRSGRYRISILREQDVLRVERASVFGWRRIREVTLAHVVGVFVDKGPEGTARVVLETSEGSDVPLTRNYLGEAPGHEYTRQELLAELTLPRSAYAAGDTSETTPVDMFRRDA